MQEKIQKLTNDISEKWQGLNKQQQMRLALGIIGLIVAIGVTIYLATRPRMVSLYTNTSYATILEIQTVLNEAGIRNNLIQNGRGIEVRQQDVGAARLEIEGRADIFSPDSFVFGDMLERMSMGTPDGTRRDMSRAALQGELEVMLRQLDGIDDATVRLNIPDTGLFLRDRHLPTATVFLSTSLNIDNHMALTVAQAIAGAVEGLTVENIVIMNQRMQTVFDGGSIVEDGFNVDLDLERQRRNEIEGAAFMLLNPLYDEVRVMSNIRLNQDRVNQIAHTRENPLGDGSNTGLLESEQILNENATGTPIAGGEPGLGANDGGVPVFGMGGGATETEASREQATRAWLYNELIEERLLGTGYILTEDSSMSIMVYNHIVHDETILRNTGQLDDITWDEFIALNNEPVMMEIPEEIIENIRIGSGLDNVIITGMALPVFLDASSEPLNWSNIFIFVILAAFIGMLAYGLVKRTQEEEVIEVEPELSVEDLLVTTRIEEEKEKEEAEKLQDINFSKESEVKTQIENFVNEKPEAVAQLLRSWINDGWE